MKTSKSNERIHAIAMAFIGILTLSLLASPVLAEGDSTDGSRLFITPDGLYWTDDMQVTRNSAPDTVPQITVDRNHDAHIFWMRDGYWYYKKFDRFGNALTKELRITNLVNSGKLLSERVVDIDSNQDIHFIWSEYGYDGDVLYIKFDNQGNVLIPAMVAVKDIDNVHVPNMAISSDDAVNIIYEDYQYQCEDINYHKLVGTKVALSYIAISSDVASHCEFCNIATDKYNTVYANFGSNTGSWIGAVNSEGVHPWPSQQLPIKTSYNTAGMVCSPDTYVHLAWFESASLFYQRYDMFNVPVSEPIIIDSGLLGDHQIWDDNRNPGIASDGHNNIVITYTKDNYVYYKYIKAGTWNETKAGGYRLTTSATCRRPRVAIDPDDNVHIVWEDTRTRNNEVCYKFAYNFQFTLQADQVQLSNMYFFHPNETKELPFQLINTGGIADRYDVRIDLDDGAYGWTVALNSTYCELAGNERAYFKLTETSPSYAVEGDKIFINISAKSRGNPERIDRLNFISFIVVTHDVSLMCHNMVNIVLPGKSVSYNLFVTNTGDVTETIKLLGIIAAPEGWAFRIESHVFDENGMAQLESRAGTDLTVTVTSPEDAKANDNATLSIQAFDMERPEASSTVVLRTLVTPIFYLLWDCDVTEKWINPGESDQFTLKLTNYGNVVGTAQIRVDIQSDLRGWDAMLDREEVQLRGGESTVIKLLVKVPASALAGQRLVVRTVAETFTLAQKAYIDTTAFVNIVHNIAPSVETREVQVFPGQTAEYIMTVKNDGNGEDKVELGVVSAQHGWAVTFEYTDLEVDRVIIGPGTEKTVTIKVRTPYEAEAGTFTTYLVLRDAGGKDNHVSVRTAVAQVFDFDLRCSQVHQVGTPGGFITYPMAVENLGNGHDAVELQVTSMPDGWNYQFKDLNDRQITTVDLDYGSKVDIRLNMWVAEDQMESDVHLEARAQSMFEPSRLDQIQLAAEICMPDLKIQSVEFNPSKMSEDQVVQIRVLLQNVGTGGASDVVVEFYDDGDPVSRDRISFITSGEAGNATAVFTWLPRAGTHRLRFFVDPTNATMPHGRVLESDEGNNIVDMSRSARSDSGLPGPSASMAFGALLAAMGIAVLLRRKQ